MRLTAIVGLADCSLTFVLRASVARAAVTNVITSKVVPLPDLTVIGRTQTPYILANPCGAGEAAITFRLAIRNIGGGAEQANS